MSTAPKELLISHLFDAPQEAVFQAWTDPEQLKHWYAPDGCTIEFKSIDVKPGGHFHSCIHDPEHGDCWITGTYLEVIPPEKLVLTMALSNENGQATNALEAGKPEDWPAEILTTVTFRTIAGQTQVTIHQTVAEAEAKKTGAYQSWIKMFYKLNQLLTQ
jgi:uncharacterized protein YndB with AHSA1/START domain